VSLKGGASCAAAALAAFLSAAAAAGAADRWSLGWIDYVEAGPGAALAARDARVLRGIYGSLPIDVAVQDYDADGHPEYLVRHLANCALVAEAPVSVIGICPFTVVDRVGGAWTEVLRESGWRSRSLLLDGRVVGLDLDGFRWTGSQAGHMRLVALPLAWREPDEGALRTLLDEQFGPIRQFQTAAVEVAGRSPVIAWDRAGGSRADWAVIHAGEILKAGQTRGEPVVATSRLGELRIADSATGGILTRVQFPLTAPAWLWHWEQPDMPAGWHPVVLRARRDAGEDPDSLWSPAEIASVPGDVRIWRGVVPLPEGRVLLSWLPAGCGHLECPVRATIAAGADDGVRLRFDGRATGRACVAGPHVLGLGRPGGDAMRLRACGRIIVLTPEPRT